MGILQGQVNNRQATKGLRRKCFDSEIITISNGATANLVTHLGKVPASRRIILDSFAISNVLAISNHGLGALSIGHATADGTFDDDSIMSFNSATMNTSFKNTAIHLSVTFNSTNFLNTLVTNAIKHPIALGKPIIPANSTIVITDATMATSGTGAQKVWLWYWEWDDITND